MINKLAEELKKTKSCAIHYVFAPGNHDCDFDKSTSVRDSLIGTINAVSDNTIYEAMTEVQSEYYNFCKTYNMTDNKLISKVELRIKGGKVLFLVVNSAWMSIINENPGGIIIPEALIPEVNNRDYCAVFTVMHHPINWYNPDYQRPFIDFVRKNTDLLFVGHEHIVDTYSISGNNWSVKEIHAQELQDSNSMDSGFFVINFADSFQQYSLFEYKWNNNKDKLLYERTDEKEEPFFKNPSINNSVFQPNDNTLDKMNDPGISINHFSKDNISIRDIYIWPDLIKSDLKNESFNDKLIRDNIFKELSSNRISLINGEEACGKTSLAKMMFLSYIEDDACCIVIDAKLLTSVDTNKIEKTIEEEYSNQYSDKTLDEFVQLSQEQKILIVDNFNNMKPLGDRRNTIINFLFNYFGKIIILMSHDIEIPQLLSAECLKGLDELPYYEIKPFGNSKRSKFIKNWYHLNNRIQSKETDERIENAIKQVDAILGNGTSFMPSMPVFLITTLQNLDSINPTTFNGSKFSSLYEMLIQSSLFKNSNANDYVSSGAYNIDVSVLSVLAYNMLIEKSLTFTEDDLYSAVSYINSKKKLSVNGNKLLTRMIASRIFFQEIENSNCYRFRYPYIYYYFVGYYIAHNENRSDVKDRIEYMSKKLYNEDYGNIMIFVCHFANSVDIIETILINAYSILENYEKFKFEDSNPFFENMQSIIEYIVPKNIGDNNDVERNKEKRLEDMDRVGITDGTLDKSHDTINDEITEKEKDLASLSAAFKTLDVLGQILQNYPGSIDGSLKIEIIDEIHELGMKSVSSVISTMGLLEDELINYFYEDYQKDNPSKSRDEIVFETKKFITFVLSNVVRAMIKKIALSINSEYLLPAADETFTNEGSISAKLIMQELKINCLHKIYYKEIEQLYDELIASCPFASSILKSSVANYLKYNECEYKLRDKLCTKFSLNKKTTYLESQKRLAENN